MITTDYIKGYVAQNRYMRDYISRRIIDIEKSSYSQVEKDTLIEEFKFMISHLEEIEENYRQLVKKLNEENK